MAVLGDDRVAELFVEVEIGRKLKANANSDLRVSLGVGVAVRPHHQRPTDTLALDGGIDGDAPHMESASLTIEPQAADRLLVKQRQGTA